MFKTKLLAAALAFGLSGMASASITGGSTGNTEFVFSAFADGKGYTFDLSDAGFNSVFGTNVKMNSLLTSTTHTASAVASTLKSPVGQIVFDLALPDFSSFMSGVTASNVKWNLVSAEVSGLYRIIQTVSTAPVSTLTNTAIITAASKFDAYTGAVNGKGTNVGGDVLVDGVAQTVTADGASYAGNLGSNLGGTSYSSTGGLNDTMGLWMIGSTTSVNSTTAGRFAALATAAGNQAKAKIVLNANDNLYHLVVAVPEPETYAMLLAGLGLLGFVARRNRRA